MFTLPEPVGVEKELVDILRKMWDHYDFIIGTRVCLKTDEERSRMIEAIQTGEVRNTSEISEYAWQIHEEREEVADTEGRHVR